MQKETTNLTDEQKAIISSTGNIKINAVAGSGKTTTIIQYAASRPKGSRILYLAFNKSVRLEAQKRFSELGLSNVQVETAHSLAFRHIVKGKGYTVCQKDYKTYEIAEMLGLQGNGEKHGEYILANHISKFIAYFCNSSAERVQDLNYLDLVTEEKARIFVTNFYSQIEQGTRLLLGKMYNKEIEITHDFYLKMFQLSKPRLPFDYILFDEGQDASPAMLDVFLKQEATKVMVGDTHQQIYSWRHAVNSLGKVDFPNYSLTTSFRFSPSIARLSAEILSWKRHLGEVEPVVITGKGKPARVKTKATIARTNLGLLLKAILYIKEHKDAKRLYFEGNLNSYTYADDGASLYDVLNLHNDNHDRIRDKLIRSMTNLEELDDYIEKTDDVQLGMMVEIVREFGDSIPSLLQSLKNAHVSDEEKEKSEMIFSTVHRAKGMEYDDVELAEDFISEAKLERLMEGVEEDALLDMAKLNEEINLLYVAVTRTKGLLRIPESLLPINFPNSADIQVIKAKKQDPLREALGSVGRVPVRNKSNQIIPAMPPPDKTYTVLEKRRMHKNAYERWTTELDTELKDMYYKGVQLAKLAEHFGRNKGAILSRLKKLGCLNYE
ncbi:UvrD-helicase domain-containing protein [Flavihumibacter rivuli]|uniref:UvrD-helicase domain-containing protein n=1 Tax=Flavihumibacter rivuli TaxID=2838156 RepID=UPI001BDE5600|nr:UvrD-helicase domain-containing protein [Flavihumibacter rivuli]ULQ55991.1 UvrD-helicase domain-containing protein [Flavihumibacter rivuli]